MAGQERHISVWNACLRIFEQNVEPKQFSIWFKTIVPVSLESSTLTLEVPTDFFRDYLESAFLPIIKTTLRRVIGPEAAGVQGAPGSERGGYGLSCRERNDTGQQAGLHQHLPAFQQSGSFVFPASRRCRSILVSIRSIVLKT